MSDLIGNPSLVVILGIIAPFVISTLKRGDWPAWAKQLLAMGVALAIGLAAVALRVEADATEWSVDVIVGHCAAVFVIAQGVYNFLLKDSTSPAGALNAKLEAVGDPAPRPEPPEGMNPDPALRVRY